MKKIGKLFSVLMLGVMLGSVGIISNVSVSAGIVDVTVLEDNFNGDQLNASNWYSKSNTGISLEKEYDAYILKGGWGNTGLFTKESISGGMAMELDIAEADWNGVDTNLFMVTGLAQAGSPNWGGTGVYLSYKSSVPAITLAGHPNSFWDLVDANGNKLPYQTPWAFASMVGLGSGADQDRIENKTVRFEYAADGSFTLLTKTIGSAEDFTVLAKSSSKLPEFAEGHVGFYVCNGATDAFPLLALTDMRVYNAEDELVSEFGNNFEDDYVNYVEAGTESASYSSKKSLTFGKSYANNNPLFLRNKIEVSEKTDTQESIATYNFSVCLKEMVGDKRFGLLLGAEKQSSGRIGQADTSYLWIEKTENGYQCGMDTYKEENVATAVLPATAIDVDFSSDVNVMLQLGSLGTLNIAFDGTTVFSGTKEFTYEGYTGFAVDGAETDEENYVVATIGSFECKNNYYDRPQNVNQTTNFTNDEYNKNLWNINSTSYMSDFLNGMYVKDGKLIFDNVANEAYVSTKHQYSNFELKYSITDIRREVVVDEGTGNKIYPVSSWIGVLFGASFGQGDRFGTMEQYCPLIYFEAPVNNNTWEREIVNGKPAPTRLVILNMEGGNQFIDLPDKYDFWDPSKDGLVVDVKMTMVDGTFTVAIKYSMETEYTEIAKVVGSSCKTGHIYLCGTGNSYYAEPNSIGASCGNFALDDISVTNLDENANLTTVEFASSKIADIPTDYEYTNAYGGEEYAPKGNVAEGGCGSVISGSVLVVPTLGFVLLKKRKNGREEE